ncbi:MAG: hypothetical protein OCC46_02515 [Pseudodesulfovibrio sp.]
MNDHAFGGEGDDNYIWGTTLDGNDTFTGGDGNDELKLELHGTGQSSLQGAFENGYLTLTIEGQPDFVPTFDSNGHMILPEGVSGTITGPTGETMSFTNVETISSFGT